MATQLQMRRGTASEIAAFTGAEGEVVVNTTNDSIVVSDGSTAGGFEQARADLNNVSDASLNAALSGNTVSALTITTLTLGATAITATGAEINILDGVTATAAELNILDGVTSTAAELNILDGVTATTAELNFVDGVTSAIQTQLDAKAPLASPTFTGTVNAAALTVDTTTLVVDSTNNRVGVGMTPTKRLSIKSNGNSDIVAVEYSASAVEIVALAEQNDHGAFFVRQNDGTTQHRITATGGVIFNDGGIDQDFRVESDTNTHALFVEGSSGNVGIGREPRVGLDVASEVAIAYDANYGLRFYNQPQNNWSFIGNDVTTSSADLRFGDSTGEVMRLTGGKVGVGTSSPSRLFHSLGGSGVSTVGKFEAGGTQVYIQLSNNGASDADSGYIGYDSSSNLTFFTDNTERARIDSSGALLRNTTSATVNSASGEIVVVNNGNKPAMNVAGESTSSRTGIIFTNPNGTVGLITMSGSSTTYSTSSDYRLKENIADADDAGSKIDAIKVRKFDWKVDGTHQDYGMVAQELQTVAPEAVPAPEDPNEMMGVDYSKLVPMLVKEIQSLRARVAQLEQN